MIFSAGRIGVRGARSFSSLPIQALRRVPYLPIKDQSFSSILRGFINNGTACYVESKPVQPDSPLLKECGDLACDPYYLLLSLDKPQEETSQRLNLHEAVSLCWAYKTRTDLNSQISEVMKAILKNGFPIAMVTKEDVNVIYGKDKLGQDHLVIQISSDERFQTFFPHVVGRGSKKADEAPIRYNE